MNPERTAVLQGTLELLIMKALSLESAHGWGIAQRLQELSRGRFDVNQGSIYPALQRMKTQGWVTSEWRTPGMEPGVSRRIAVAPSASAWCTFV